MSNTGADAIVNYSQPAHNIVARIIGAALMLGVAYIHYLDLGGKMSEVPYLGYMYIALIAGLIVSAILLFARPRAGWTLGGTLALLTFIGYCVNRTVGMPGAMDDIGNWSESIGVTSLVVEGAMILLSAVMLGLRRSTPTNRSYCNARPLLRVVARTSDATGARGEP